MLLTSLPPSPEQRREDREWGLQLVHNALSLPLPPPHALPLLLGPFHVLQFLMKLTRVGPSHGVQSFRSRLLQHGAPQVHKSYHEPAPGWALHRVTACFRAQPPAPSWGLPQAARYISAPLWTSMCYRGHSVSMITT